MKPRQILTALIALSAVAACFTAEANINECSESGPIHHKWQCLTSASVSSNGSLTFTNLNLVVGQTVVAPTLATAPAFTDGKFKFFVNYDCVENTNYNHWVTNTLRYLAGDLRFSPSVPSVITNAGTNTYTAYVDLNPLSIVGWWPGEGSGSELIYSNNAVLAGTGYAAGKVGQGFSFDGVNDYAFMTNSTHLNIGATNDFTIEAWVQASSSATGNRTIMAKAGTMGSCQRGFAFLLSSGKPQLSVWTTTGTNSFTATASSNLLDDAWHHVAVTVDRDSAAGLIFYVDGAAVQTNDPTAYHRDMVNTGTLKLGSWYTGATNFFMGTIDEPSLYQCALSASDIAAIYSAGSSGKKWTNSPPDAAPLPVGCFCDIVTVNVGTLTIRAITSTSGLDTDGDGVPDNIELAQGRNPNSPTSTGSQADSSGTLGLTVFTPLH